MNPFGSSGPFLLLPSWPVKASFGEVFSLPPRRDLSYPREHPPLGGRYESEALLCDQCPQRYGPPLSGGWTRRGCRHPNVPTTADTTPRSRATPCPSQRQSGGRARLSPRHGGGSWTRRLLAAGVPRPRGGDRPPPPCPGSRGRLRRHIPAPAAREEIQERRQRVHLAVVLPGTHSDLHTETPGTYGEVRVGATLRPPSGHPQAIW